MLSLTHFGTNDVTSRTSAPTVSNDVLCRFPKMIEVHFFATNN